MHDGIVINPKVNIGKIIVKTETLKSTSKSCSAWVRLYPAITHAFKYCAGQISLCTKYYKMKALIEETWQGWTAASHK